MCCEEKSFMNRWMFVILSEERSSVTKCKICDEKKI